MTAGRERFSLRRVLVATQIALSLVLLVGALLFIGSLHNLLTVDAGFHSEGVLAVNLDLRRPEYGKERLPVVYRDLLERLSARPGVVSAAQVWFTPVSGSGWNNSVGPDATELSPTEIAAKINKDPVEWNARIEALRNVGLEVLDIVAKKNTKELWDASENLDVACAQCHASYWYPKEDKAFYRALDKRLRDLPAPGFPPGRASRGR